MPRRHEPQLDLGRAIKRTRLAKKKTQRQVAEAASADVSWYARLERGGTNPAWGTVERIAKALGVSVAELAQEAEREAAGRADEDQRHER